MEHVFLPHKRYMQEALALAAEALRAGEVPVGAVLEHRGDIIGRGRNRREATQNPAAHAELDAIQAACRALGSWRLTDCRLYVTLEPCPMCAGALLQARVPQVVYGADDPRAGALGTAIDIAALQVYPAPAVYRGFMEDECRALLLQFFEGLRT